MSVLNYSLQLRFVDVDGFGHVNNAVYLSYLENAREELYRVTGVADTLAEQFILVAGQRIEYRRVLLFGGTPVTVTVWVSRLGRSSFDLAYRVHDDDSGAEFAVATTNMVVVSRETGQPMPLSDEQRAALEGYLGDPVEFRN